MGSIYLARSDRGSACFEVTVYVVLLLSSTSAPGTVATSAAKHGGSLRICDNTWISLLKLKLDSGFEFLSYPDDPCANSVLVLP